MFPHQLMTGYYLLRWKYKITPSKHHGWSLVRGFMLWVEMYWENCSGTESSATGPRLGLWLLLVDCLQTGCGNHFSCPPKMSSLFSVCLGFSGFTSFFCSLFTLFTLLMSFMSRWKMWVKTYWFSSLSTVRAGKLWEKDCFFVSTFSSYLWPVII